VVDRPKTAVITCRVLEDEIEHFVRSCPHIVHIEKLPQGLHNEPDKLRRELQEAIDKVENEFAPEAIVVGYGLCSRGTEGVRTSMAKLVVARAHDCITLLLGSKERYANYVRRAPGTYWYSPGWNKHHLPPGEERYRVLREEYVSKYGEDNAEFLMETEQHWFTSYDRATYVDLGPGATEEDVQFTKACARWLGWNFDRQKGDPGLLKALLNCEWDEERFLILEPGQTLRLTADNRVMEAVPADAN